MPKIRFHPSALIELLANHGVKESLDLEEVAKFCSKAAMGIDQEEIFLATGSEPEPGKDGWLELTVKTASDDLEFEENEQGKVDLRTLQTVTNLEIGQQIGIIHPPETGEPGTSANDLRINLLTQQKANLERSKEKVDAELESFRRKTIRPPIRKSVPSAP